MRKTLFLLPPAFGLVAVLTAACGGKAGDSSGSGATEPPPQGMVSVLDPTCGVTTEVAANPTYAEHVAPLLMNNCTQCHVKGGIAPFPLTNYDETKPYAGLIKDRVVAREMPPFNPDNCGECNTFKDVHWLTSEEIATIAAWSDAQAPSGDLTKAPTPPAPSPGLVEANATIDMGVSYTPDASKSDDYRCFVVDPGLTTDTFITAYDIVPGDSRVVHHVIAFALDTANADTNAEALDAADPGPGYTCFGGPNVAASRFVAGWAPGGGATRFPKGTGLKLNAGRKMVLQIHYNLAGGAFPDQTKMKAVLADTVAKEALISRIATNDINLPPGQPLVTATGENTVPAMAGTVTIWGVAPHMHQTGKTMHVESDHNGTKQCLLNVNNWDFHWQSFSMYDTPPTVSGGDIMRITCGYDTSGRTTVTTNGEGTENEMCIAFFYVTR